MQALGGQSVLEYFRNSREASLAGARGGSDGSEGQRDSRGIRTLWVKVWVEIFLLCEMGSHESE